MPALCVAIDEITVATVSTTGLDMISVRASGRLTNESVAELEVTGGRYPEDGESTYLTWLSLTALKPGQVVKVTMRTDAPSSHAGKTIDELFPDEDQSEIESVKSHSEIYADLRQAPKFHERFSFRAESSLGRQFTGHTSPSDHGFTFSALWHSSHPDCTETSLYGYSLDSLEHHGPLNNYFKERLHAGDSVAFELIP